MKLPALQGRIVALVAVMVPLLALLIRDGVTHCGSRARQRI